MLTKENLQKMADALGWKLVRGENRSGWERFYIHVPQPDGIPLSMGRIMFKDGQFQWIKWYYEPANGEIQDADRHFLAYNLYIHIGETIPECYWPTVREAAEAYSQAKLQAGEWKKPNLRRAARDLMGKYITEASGSPCHIQAY